MILQVFQTTFVVLALTTVVHAQQVASKDLVRSPAAVMATIPAQTEQEPGHAKGCAEWGAGFVDSVTLNEDKRTRKLKVGLVKISITKLVIGTEIIATAKLQNIGSKSVQIPWSTDFSATMDSQDPDDRSWEFAEFRMSIRDKQNATYFDRLVTTSQPLYASEVIPGSYLTLKPGEWITARISFRVDVQRPEFEKLSVGTAGLAMQWFQTVRTRVVKNCGVTLGYFSHEDRFSSLNRRVVAQVQIEPPAATAKAAP